MLEETKIFSSFSTTAAKLHATDVCINYGDTLIVKNATLTAQKGDITALVGPNGCGKSTLLKALSRVLLPLSGEISLDGENIHQLPTRKLAQKLSLLPQGPIAPEGLTVHELVMQGRFPHQRLFSRWHDDDQQAVNDAMADTGVSTYAERPVQSLSGGQRQRCWLAMILAQATDVILLDEPTTFLDLKVQIDMMTLLARISKEKGRTLLIVLHELNLAAAFADQIIMMREGHIICQGTPSDIMTPQNIETTFHVKTSVIKDPLAGHPVCIPNIGARS